MSQTILILADPDLRKLYAINLNTYAGTDVIVKKNAMEVIELLQILPTIDLIIAGPANSFENTPQKIHEFMIKNQISIPLIALGDEKELPKEILRLKQPVEWEILIKHACNVLGVTPEELQNKVIPHYVAIDLNYFYEITHTPCDIYIRIRKSDNDYQFVKRLHALDSFTALDIDKYKNQGLSQFYVTKDYQQYFVNFVTNSLIKKLETNNLPLFERLTANSSAYLIVADKIQQAGMSEQIAELASSSIESMIKAVKQTPRLASLLKMLLSTKISYAYQHAHLVMVLGEFILSKQPWYEAKHLDIFTAAAFFSDINLKSIEQIRINSTDELERSSLTKEEKDEVNYHARTAAELVKEHPLHTEYVEKVIREHQGSLNGIGFGVSAGEDIHPLAKVFIVSDAFVKMMLDPNAPKNKKDILTVLYAQFTGPSYQKIVKVLEQKID